MAISIRSNVASIKAQVDLFRSNQRLSQSEERLSTGLRINRASDDAAAIAVSSRVKADEVVYKSANRNVNDGINYINTAQTAVGTLTDILSSLNELATRSKGSMTAAQRSSLDDEFQSLRTEYNRIVNDTEYNYTDIFTASNSTLTVQAGYSSTAQISAALTGGVVENTGTGSFSTQVSYSAGTEVAGELLSDVNGDGNVDLITNSSTDNKFYVMLGNGNGTFQARTSYVDSTASSAKGVSGGDFNGDGLQDIVMFGTGNAQVYLGNGDGTFKAATSYTNTSATASFGSVADFNGDGYQDLAMAGGPGYYIMLGNGTGSFKAAMSFASTLNSEVDVKAFDFNGDSILDIVTNGSNNQAYVSLGNGNGTFKAATSFMGYSAASTSHITAGDLNGDGYLDLVQGNSPAGSVMSVMLGNGNGTFKAFTSYNGFSTAIDPHLADMNSDGYLDFVSGGSSVVSVALGNGDGSFKARTQTALSTSSYYSQVADLNGDNAPDLVIGSTGNPQVLLQTYTVQTNTKRVQTLGSYAIDTLDGAEIAATDTAKYKTYLNAIDAQLAADNSRLATADSLTSQQSSILEDSYNQIVSADIPREAEHFIRSQLFVQAAQTVYQAANDQQQLAGSLIDKLL